MEKYNNQNETYTHIHDRNPVAIRVRYDCFVLTSVFLSLLCIPPQQRVPFPQPHLPRMKVFAVIMRRFVPRFIIRDRNLSHAVKWNYVLREKANATPYGSGSAQCATPRCVCVCAVRSLRICINSDISYEQPAAGASSRPARVFPPRIKGLRVSVPFWPAVPLSIASPCFFLLFPLGNNGDTNSYANNANNLGVS